MIRIEQVFQDVTGAAFVGLDTLTQVKLLGGKSNMLQGHVMKRTLGSSVMVFQNKRTNGYDAMIRRRLLAEGKNPASFKLSPRTWGVRRQGSPFVDHDGKVYLEVIFLRPPVKSEFLIDGVVTPAKEINGLPAEDYAPEQGGLDDKVILRTYKIASLIRVRIDGQEIVLRKEVFTFAQGK